jgi:ubiquinone biosynthesis protein
LGRARQIAEVLARHHLGHVIQLLALEELVPLRYRAGTGRPSALITPVQLRSAVEELGPTFIKLGQVLSTRADLLPKEFQLELSSLQDKATPVHIDDVLETIAPELGEPADLRFAKFEHEPLATGSIGQAHAARLLDGTEVVVKVRRPGAAVSVHGRGVRRAKPNPWRDVYLFPGGTGGHLRGPPESV